MIAVRRFLFIFANRNQNECVHEKGKRSISIGTKPCRA